MSKVKSKRTHETIAVGLVIFIALVGLYYMYTVSTGRAFLQAPTITVRQSTLDVCCCKTVPKGYLFETYGKMYKDEDKPVACDRICSKEHGTTAHPVLSAGPGKCGAYSAYG